MKNHVSWKSFMSKPSRYNKCSIVGTKTRTF